MKAMSFAFKKIISPLALVSFLAVAFLGFTAMSYGSDGRMQGDCPFSAAGVVQCPVDAFVAAMHHIGAYQSFLTVPVNAGMTALISALLIIIFAPALFIPPLLFRFPIFIPHASAPPTSRDRKIRHWLSLHEHSPSL